MVVVTAGTDIMLIIITDVVVVTVVVTRIVSLCLLLLDRRHRGMNRRKGGIQIWVVEVIFIGADTLLCVSWRVLPAKDNSYTRCRSFYHCLYYLPELKLFPVDGVLLLALLLGHQGGGVPGDVGVAGVGRVARGDGGHGHRDLGPRAAHRETVHTVVVVSVTCLTGRNCRYKKI